MTTKDDYVWITLSEGEIFQAEVVGFRRQREAMKAGLKPNAGYKAGDVDYMFHIHAIGALGEQVVAKHLNIFWSMGVNTFKDPDVGPFQVRTAQELTHRLIVRPTDNPKEKFIFVRGIEPDFQICGWIYGKDARVRGKWEDKLNNMDPAWFVEAKFLEPISTVRGKYGEDD
jgi:hypothetical protein